MKSRLDRYFFASFRFGARQVELSTMPRYGQLRFQLASCQETPERSEESSNLEFLHMKLG